MGKTVLACALVVDLNRSIFDDPSKVRAVLVTAPVPHREGFSWGELWIAVLDALDDPLPACTVDREAMADALRRGVSTMIQRATEGALRRAVSAARRRGLEWLFADEAVALVKAGHGRVLRRVAGRPFRAPRSRAGTPSRGLRVRTQPPPSTSHSPPTAAVFQATPPPRHDRQGRDRDSGRGPARESAEGERGLVIFEKDNSIAPSFVPSDLYCYLFGRGATD